MGWTSTANEWVSGSTVPFTPTSSSQFNALNQVTVYDGAGK